MTVAQDLNAGLYFYLFNDKKGDRHFEYGFTTEKEATLAELKKRSELSRKVVIHMKEYDYKRVVQAIYHAANTVDIVFPSQLEPLIHAYETMSQKKFVRDYGMSHAGARRNGEDWRPAKHKKRRAR